MADLKLVALFLIVCGVASALAAPAEPENFALAQKFDFLANLLKKYNVDVDAIMAKISAASEKRHLVKRETTAIGDVTNSILDDGLSGIIDGIFRAIVTALKSITDSILASINASTNGIFADLLPNLQGFIYGLIDKTFPSTSTTYTSSSYYSI